MHNVFSYNLRPKSKSKKGGGWSSEQYSEQSFESKLFGTANFKHIWHKNWVDFGIGYMRDGGAYFLWAEIRFKSYKLKS